MPTAEVSTVEWLVSLEGLCENCSCQEGHRSGPDFLQVASTNYDTMSSVLELSSDEVIDGEPIVMITDVEVAGLKSEKDVAQEFNNCKNAQWIDGRFVCGAIVALRERVRHGREEVLAR